MKANDFIQMLEYMKTFNKPASAPKQKKGVSFKEFTKLLKEYEEFQKFVKEQEEKSKKLKEEKKKDGLGFTVVQRAVFLTILSPLVGLGYLAVLSQIANAVVHSMGLK